MSKFQFLSPILVTIVSLSTWSCSKPDVETNSSTSDQSDVALYPYIDPSPKIEIRETRSIASLSRLMREEGRTVEKLRSIRYEVDGGYRTYQLQQKLGDYFIYGEPLGTPSFVDMQRIVVLPMEGEPVIEGKFLPGRFYRCIGVTELESQTGFPVKLPVLERIMSNEAADGYGIPPEDPKARIFLTGYWTNGIRHYKKNSKDVLYVHHYEPNGDYTRITYEREKQSSDEGGVGWEKYIERGSWKIADSMLTIRYSSGSSSGSSQSKIIKLNEKNLITVSRYEESYFRIVGPNVSDAETAVPWVTSVGF